MATNKSSSSKTANEAEAFPCFNKEQREKLQDVGHTRTFKNKETLFKEGDTKSRFFVILKGKVRVTEGTSEEPRWVTTHQTGEFTGDIDVLTGYPSAVTATAQGEVEALEVEASALRTLLKTLPEIGKIIMNGFLMRRSLLKASGLEGFKLVGSRWSEDTIRIKDFLTKNRAAFHWEDIESNQPTHQFLTEHGIKPKELPLLVCSAEVMMKNPTNQEMGEYLGLNTEVEDQVYDVAILGGGPAGLAAAVYGASEGLNTVLIEAEAPGGQAASSSKIENYLGFPSGLSGLELADKAFLQAKKFDAAIVSPKRAQGLSFQKTYHEVALEGGDVLRARAVVLCTGAQYRRLPLENLSDFEGKNVFYSATKVEAQMCQDQSVVIVGGANSAGQAAVFLSQYAKKVYLLVRGETLEDKMSQYLCARIKQIKNIDLRTRTEVEALTKDEADELCQIAIRDHHKEETTKLKACALFSFIGAIPNTDWLPSEIAKDDKGYVLTGTPMLEALSEKKWSLSRSPHLLETSVPGVFAAGDIRSGAVKRVASAVGSGSMAIQFVHEYLSNI